MKEQLRNLGPKSTEMLQRAGITTVTQLRELGPARAFVAVKRCGASPSLNLLWALEGALSNRPWQEVAKSERLSLLLQVENEEIQAELDKHSRNGWKVRAMSTSNQCSYTQANGAQVKGECQVIILERERK